MNRDNDRTRSPLMTRDFVLLVAGQGISLFGNMMLRFAMSMWVLDETGSSAVFASILAVSVIPTILLSPFGGVLADRMNRRTIMVALDALSGLLVLVCALVFAGVGFQIAVIAVMQVLLAVLGAFETPTVQAALPQMFREHGQATLRRAMAVVNQTQQLSSLLPSFLGGVLYAMLGIRPLLAITIVSFALAAGLECLIRLAAPDRSASLVDGRMPTPLEDFRAGIRFLVRERPAVFRLMLVAAVLNVFTVGPSSVGFPYTIRTVLGFDATVYGVSDGLLGIAGVVGAFVAGLAAARLAMRHLPVALTFMVLPLALQGVTFLLPVGAWTRLAVLVALECGAVIACSFSNLIVMPTIQMSTPEAMTGKVMSICSAMAMCAQPVGQMLYGWAYGLFPVAAVLLASAAGLAALTALTVPLSHRFAQ